MRNFEIVENLEIIAIELKEQCAELVEARAELIEAHAENARLAAEYQSAANEICTALGVEWTTDNRYPTVAVKAIERLQAALKRLVCHKHVASDLELLVELLIEESVSK